MDGTLIPLMMTKYKILKEKNMDILCFIKAHLRSLICYYISISVSILKYDAKNIIHLIIHKIHQFMYRISLKITQVKINVFSVNTKMVLTAISLG